MCNELYTILLAHLFIAYILTVQYSINYTVSYKMKMVKVYFFEVK